MSKCFVLFFFSNIKWDFPWLKFCHNLSFLLLSEFEFLTFVKFWVIEFCHKLSFVTAKTKIKLHLQFWAKSHHARLLWCYTFVQYNYLKASPNILEHLNCWAKGLVCQSLPNSLPHSLLSSLPLSVPLSCPLSLPIFTLKFLSYWSSSQLGKGGGWILGGAWAPVWTGAYLELYSQPFSITQHWFYLSHKVSLSLEY